MEGTTIVAEGKHENGESYRVVAIPTTEGRFVYRAEWMDGRSLIDEPNWRSIGYESEDDKDMWLSVAEWLAGCLRTRLPIPEELLEVALMQGGSLEGGLQFVATIFEEMTDEELDEIQERIADRVA